jgi:hypothetical protein
VDFARNLMRGTKLGVIALLVGAAIGCGSSTATAALEPVDAAPSGFGQDLAAPPDGRLNQLVGSVSAPVADVAVHCVAPWKQWGFGLKDFYTACVAAP